MSRTATAEHEGRSSKRILLVSAVLSALFTYLAFASLATPLLDLLYPLPLYDPNYTVLPLVLALAGAAGVGLRWIARRYRTPTVQAGALVGAVIMTGLGVWMAGTRFGYYARVGKVVATLPVGLFLLVAVAGLTANPSSRTDERTGIALLWGAVRGPWTGVLEDRSSRAEPIEGSADGEGPESEGPSDWRRVLSVSKYWRVVGGAFLVCTPLALVDTELGIGLLSTFLTAYGLSHRIDGASKGIDDEG